MLNLVNRENTKQEKLPPQVKIERELAKVVNLGNIECAFLFSSEGLLLAGVQGQSDFTQNEALEITYSVNDAVQFFQEASNFSGIQEILLTTQSRRKISIRVFEAFQQQLSLVFVIPRARTYRAHANRLIRTIQKISQAEIK